MSDHGHHDPGGHELEAINTKMLFRLFFALIPLTLAASYGVIQWFYFQRAELEDRYAMEGSIFLEDYKTNMGEQLSGMDGVAQRLATDPKLLAAPAPPPGWVHPDDLVGGGDATPAATAPAAAKDDGHDHADGTDHGHADGTADHEHEGDKAPAEGEPPAEGEAAPAEGGDAPADAGDKPADAGEKAAEPAAKPEDAKAAPAEAKSADNAE